MIERVLIAEDHESANISIQKTLDDLRIAHSDYVYYCDDALARIKTAKQLKRPYDLLITDLHFEEDANRQVLTGGMELIAAARAVQPDIKVLVFSAESKPIIIEQLFQRLEIDGYVRKARHDSKELHSAIKLIEENKRYFPRHLSQAGTQKNSHEFTQYDITIISLLANGVAQKNIPTHLQAKGISPVGLSSIEKRLNHMREVLSFSKNEQLVAYCKDMGII